MRKTRRRVTDARNPGLKGLFVRVAGLLMAGLWAGFGSWAALQSARAAALAPLEAIDMPAACAADGAGGGGERAILASVEDAVTLRLEDGRVLRLADIDLAAPDAGERVKSAPLSAGQALVIHPESAKPDRWGRIVAHVRVPDPGVTGQESPGGAWLSGLLVARGLARVMPQEGAIGCIDALYRLEAVARQARRGLWRDAANRVWSAGDRALAENAVGAWRIVEGRVLSVGVTESNHYLNFGRDWNTDFTVTVRTRDVQRFAAAGRHPVGLEGRVVRVRGWLREWNGAAIDVRRPGEIEVVDGRD